MQSRNDEPDYENLNLADLLGIERRINKDAYPERYARLRAAIATRQREGPRTVQSGIVTGQPPAAAPRPIRTVVSQAFHEAVAHWRPLIKALIVPSGLVTILPTLVDPVDGSLWWKLASMVLTGIIGVVYATSCHRILLAGDRSLPNQYGIYWTSRETRFAGWSIAIGLLAFPLVLLLVPLLMITLVSDLQERVSWLVSLFVYAPAAYVISRASLVLPATAIDQRPSLEDSWSLSKDNGWRLTVVLAVPGLLISALLYLVETAIGVPEGRISATLFAVWICLLGVVEVTVLSAAFRFLSSIQIRSAAA